MSLMLVVIFAVVGALAILLSVFGFLIAWQIFWSDSGKWEESRRLTGKNWREGVRNALGGTVGATAETAALGMTVEGGDIDQKTGFFRARNKLARAEIARAWRIRRRRGD